MINNKSTVPESILYRTDASLAKSVFATDVVANIIKNLDSNKSKDLQCINPQTS